MNNTIRTSNINLIRATTTTTDSDFFGTVLESGFIFIKGWKFKSNSQDSITEIRNINVGSTATSQSIFNSSKPTTSQPNVIAFSIARTGNTINVVYKKQFFPEDIQTMLSTEISGRPYAGVYLIDLDKFYDTKPEINNINYRIYTNQIHTKNTAMRNNRIIDFSILDNAWCWIKFSNYLSLNSACNCNVSNELQITIEPDSNNRLFFKTRRTGNQIFEFSGCDKAGSYSNWVYILNRVCDDWGGPIWYGINSRYPQTNYSLVTPSTSFYNKYSSPQFTDRSVENWTIETNFTIDKLRLLPCGGFSNWNNSRLTSTDNGAIANNRQSVNFMYNRQNLIPVVEIVQPSLYWILKSQLIDWGLALNFCSYFSSDKYSGYNRKLTKSFLEDIFSGENTCQNALSVYCVGFTGDRPHLSDKVCRDFCKNYECSQMITDYCNSVAERTANGENVNIFDLNNQQICGCALESESVLSAYNNFVEDARRKGLILPSGPNCGIKEYTFPPCRFAATSGGYTTVDGSTMSPLPDCTQDIINCISNTTIDNQGTITGDININLRQRCYSGTDNGGDDGSGGGTTPTPKPTPKPAGASGLSTTAKIGIGVGVGLLILIIIIGVIVATRKKPTQYISPQ